MIGVPGSPISMPLICLLQLANYVSVLEVATVSPADMMNQVIGVTGHSQGLASAAVAAGSKTLDDIIGNTCNMLTFLFFLSARSQTATIDFLKATANIRIPPRRRRKKGKVPISPEGPATPTVMMAVMGLPERTLKGIIALANRAVPPKHALHMSLQNSPRQFVVSGAPRILVRCSWHMRTCVHSNANVHNMLPCTHLPALAERCIFSLDHSVCVCDRCVQAVWLCSTYIRCRAAVLPYCLVHPSHIVCLPGCDHTRRSSVVL